MISLDRTRSWTDAQRPANLGRTGNFFVTRLSFVDTDRANDDGAAAQSLEEAR